MRRHLSAFTLIELLIVVAILAILSAATLGPIVAPLREQQYAEQEAACLGSLELLLPILVADAHAAVRLEPSTDGPCFALTRRGGAAAVYRLDEDEVLRRCVLEAEDVSEVMKGGPMPPSAAPLGDGIRSFTAHLMPDGRLRVVLSASRGTHARPLAMEHDIVVRLGEPGGKGAQP